MGYKKLLSALTSAAVSLSTIAGMGAAMTNTAMTAGAAGGNWKFDFGGAGAASGYTGVSASDGYNASRGYGFAQTGNVQNVSAGGRGAGSDAVKFNNFGTGNTFNVDLPKGLYEITVTTGNSPRTTIRIEGMVQMMNLTGNNAVETIRIPVTDGQLNVQAIEGMSKRDQTISALEITQINTTCEMKPTIWICGDSTVANYYNVGDASQHGWGQFLGNYVDTAYWDIRNQATSGQYAKGFYDGGQFAPIETYGKPGDIYIISIGINDSNYSNKDEYRQVVTTMVQKAKAKGMTVLLVKQQGRRGDLQRNPLLPGRWFGGELDTVGANENVQVIDLFTPWQNFGLSVGYDGMSSYYATQASGDPDDLHQSKKGAMKLAEIMSTLYDFSGSSGAEMNENVYYAFKNVNSGLYLNADEQNMNICQQAMGDPTRQMAWRLTSTGDGYYAINSAITVMDADFLLEVNGGNGSNGQNVELGVYGTGPVVDQLPAHKDSQQFKFKRNADGSYTILSKVSDDKSAVEVTSALTDAGANVQQWEVNGHNCQKWMAEVVKLPINGRIVSDLIILDTENDSAWGMKGYASSGMKAFGDRDFTIDSLPSVLSNTEAIITACNSKNAASDEAKFKVSSDATVYIALDNRVTVPDWMSSYTKTADSYICNGETFNIYSKDLAAGEQVILGSNGTNYNCMNYSVFVKAKPVETTTTTTEATTTTTTTTTTAPSGSTSSVGKIVMGDANCDGKCSVADAVAILQHLGNRDRYELSPQGKINGDVDGDPGITGNDALFIQMVDAGLRTLPEAPSTPVTEAPVTTTTTIATETTTTTTTTTLPSKYFAVDQQWNDGWAESDHTGYTKTTAAMGSSENVGYVNLNNIVGSYITFNVTVPEENRYMAHIRYANGSDTDRKAAVYVNGDTQNYWMQSFNGTGGWDVWSEMGIVLPLKAGQNTIKLESAVSEGAPNLDYIELVLTDEPVAELYDPNAGKQTVDGNKPSVFLAGDSTCQYYNASKQAQNNGPIQGWGYYFGNYFTDDVSVYNNAVAGRSSKKFYDEGRFAAIVENLKQGDFVIIQFAINDAGASNADRYAPTCGNVDNPSSGSYEWYMTSFIKDTLAKGATPIIMSNTPSLKDYSGGKFVISYTNYTDADKKLAAKYNVPFIDCNAITVAHYNSVGYNTAASYHMDDKRHYKEGGANVIAGLIANAVKSQNINGLSGYVK